MMTPDSSVEHALILTDGEIRAVVQDIYAHYEEHGVPLDQIRERLSEPLKSAVVKLQEEVETPA